MRYLTFRLDFNNYHATQQSFGGKIGLTSTPPVMARGNSNVRDRDYNNSGGSSVDYNRMYAVNAFDISQTRIKKK